MDIAKAKAKWSVYTEKAVKAIIKKKPSVTICITKNNTRPRKQTKIKSR